ncbi:MAG: GTPase HflX [Armatimonadota bacterium]|nr:GTPase HflX [Armatimonadota bacterium]
MPRVASDTRLPAEKAVLVLVHEDADLDLYAEEELTSLIEAAGAVPVGTLHQRVDRTRTATYIGKGKVQEVLSALVDTGADVAIFDCELSGVQHRNLETELSKRIVDRTQLILDIFAQRAHTREGQLQVELAQYSYLMPRITAAYTQFERQKGGIGMRGPGETKLEADRRRIRDRIAHLTKEIDDVRQIRHRQRVARRKNPFPFASLVGYTSAGKSTIMNRLSGSEVFVDPMLFATLDPTTRKLALPSGYSVFLTDTVGFVRNLPHNLVAAFRATLEEVSESDFLLHIVDVSHPSWEIQAESVMETLAELGAGEKPTLTIYNKIDRLTDPTVLRELVANTPNSVAISATSGEGVDELLESITKMIRSLLRPVDVIIPYDKSGLVQECYDFGRVLSVEHKEDGIHIKAEIVAEMADRLLANMKR